MPRFRLFVALVLAATTLHAEGSRASAEAPEDDGPFANLEWRNVGPVNMSGRVTDVEGVPGDPRTVYVAAASGGVWKTEDGGVTFHPIFDEQPVASIGDIALAPSNPEVVYVGTGEGNPRNSVSIGNGVYRSTDGGQTWKHVGLEKTQTIPKVLVHPQDPDTVWVGALGHIFGPNEERGVFRSKDGGETWEKVLYIDDQHGVADLAIDANNPNVLFAAMWHFERKPWTHTSGSRDGGVYRSLDGGTTWKKLTEGLPKLLGRVGVEVSRSDPKTVYVIAESHEGTLFRSDDRGDTFEKVTDEVRIVSRGLYYTHVRIDPLDPNKVYGVASLLMRSIDGGKSFERISLATHIDFHALWIDPLNPKRMWQGQDGGVAVSYNGGETWDPIRSLPLAQLYQAFYDDREPFYAVGGGLQDNGTWYGPSRTREGQGIFPDDWRMMSFGDAYFVVPHPEQQGLYLSEYQAGGILRSDTVSGRPVEVNPQTRRNDGGPVGELDYRFNWNAPIVASPHDPHTVYFGGNVVFKTTDFGASWSKISPDLTTDDAEKQLEAGGPVWKENTTAEYHCTIISLAESPAQAGVLWVGTDDGNIQVSRDSGGTWANVTAGVKGLPAVSPVSHVEPSRRGAGIAYASFDRHMFDDMRPHIYVTEDFGASWTRLSSAGLPELGWVWVVREDPKNADLLYAGTEMGLFVSWDRGMQWEELDLGNLPTVAIHDIHVHPRENDLILGTHGRAIWIFDDATPIQQWKDVSEDVTTHLFEVRPGLRFASTFTRYGRGDKAHTAPNPPAGALITYYLKESLEPEPKADEGEGTEAEAAAETTEEKEPRLVLEILDANGDLIHSIDEAPLKAGLNRVAWNLAHDAPRTRSDEPGPRGAFFQAPRGPEVVPGRYTVRLTVDGESQQTSVEVRVDPTLVADPAGLEAQFDMALALRDMRSAANDALRGIDLLEQGFEARRATSKSAKRELPEEIDTGLKKAGKRLAEIKHSFVREEGKPFWSQGPRVSARLGALFQNVDSAFAAPTAAQSEYFAVLETESREALEAYNAFLAELATLNESLVQNELPVIVIPDSVGLEAF